LANEKLIVELTSEIFIDIHRQPVMSSLKTFFAKLQNAAFRRVDIASLVFFRIAFGLLMIRQTCFYLLHNRIAHLWIEPRFLFKYYGFSWVNPPPGNGLYILWAVLALLAVFIAAGFLYRSSALLFCLGFTYTFLLDEALWVNHRYLICLFSFLLIFVPAHRALSIDAWLNPKLRSQTTPAWAIWLLRAQMGVVYFFAGIAKIMPDWVRGEPMRVWLARTAEFPIFGRYFREQWAVYSLSYAAMLFDLLIVPFLIWRRTRIAAFCVAVCFHLLNFQLFTIGIFPWLAIAATTLFLSPSWPRRVLSILGIKTTAPVVEEIRPTPTTKERVVLALVLGYIAIQLLVPMRPFFYRGGIEWAEEEHRFSWRMMLTGRWVHAYFYVEDPNSGQTFQAMPNDYLLPYQVFRMGWRPDMLVQYAQYLAKVMPRTGPKPLRVEARVLVALNGRKPRLFIDQNVDLAAEKRPWGRPRWLLEIHEPLPDTPADPLHNPFEPAPEDLD
jgi:vitamin K-dependent gamma-carboxylase